MKADINFFKSVYKSYSNFVKVPENIEIIRNYNINTTKNITVNLSNYNYDLIKMLNNCRFDVYQGIGDYYNYTSFNFINTFYQSVK